MTGRMTDEMTDEMTEERAGLPPVRLIVLDVDGTLVDDDKLVPPANREALAAVRARGVEVAIASGRMVPSIERVEAALGIDCAIIAYNGGKVLGPRQSGRPSIAHRPLSSRVADGLIEFTRTHRMLLNFYLDDRLFADHSQENNPLAGLYSRRTGSEYQFTDIVGLRGRDPTKLILLAEPRERDRLLAEFSLRLSGQAYVVGTDPEYLEFMAPGVDKGTALPDLAAFFGIALEEVLAIGDADNDTPMLRVAGRGVAVANAREEVRRAARFITRRTNNEGAVAEAVERWVLREG